jgi:uncharacterized protein YceH (UPF0502 family)
MHRFGAAEEVEAALDRLTARELGRWLERRPGQKEARYAHLLEATEDMPAPAPEPGASPDADGAAAELRRLREDVDALRRDLDALRERLG